MMRFLATFAGLLYITDAVVAQEALGSFSADAAVAGGADFGLVADTGAVNRAAEELSGEAGAVADPLERQRLIPVSLMGRTCTCVPSDPVEVDDIRGISDQWAAGGNDENTFGLSNMVWGFGQFVDHDLTLTIENESGPTSEVGAADADDPMQLHRVITFPSQGCRSALNVHSPQIDAGPIYGTDESYIRDTLREPGTCRLRMTEGGFLPVTTAADSQGRFFFIAGDVRVSEHAFLTAQHVVWLREHNRICDLVDEDEANAGMSVDAKFQLVRSVIIAKFQQVVLTEFLPALGITQEDVENVTGQVKSTMLNRPDASVEFSIAYRLGHDLIGDTAGRFNIDDMFDAESFFLQISGAGNAPSVTLKPSAAQDLDDMVTALAETPANEIDGKLSNTLRDMLFGVGEGEDLAGRNIFRGRELGVPTYAGLAECFGIEPDATTEMQTPDAWLGLLREPKKPGSPIGPTLRAIILEQFHRTFFGPGGFYWKNRLSRVGSFVAEIESATYADIITNNTNAAVSGNVFKVN
eukprot:jgi/Ulvmu1/5711/UM024_0060.1